MIAISGTVATMAIANSAPTPGGQGSRIDGIDLLRGLAILYVLLLHVNIRLVIAHVPYTRGLPKQLVSSLVWNGQNGVQMFFAISGFLITSISLRRWGSLGRINLRAFYRLRFARIAPLLLLLLLVLSILHSAGVSHYVIPQERSSLPRAIFSALTFHLNWLEARHGYLPGNWDVLWSLSIEEMFYLFFPIACLLCGDTKRFVALLVIFVALGPIARAYWTHGNEIWEEKSYLGGMDAIAMGCLTALLVSRMAFSRRALRTMAACGAAVLIFCLCFAQQAYQWRVDRYGLFMSLVALGTCLVIAVSTQTKWKSPRILAPLLKLGQYSYEIYMTHMFAVFALFDLFVYLSKAMRLVVPLFLAAILVSAVLGAIVAHTYSEPMNRILRSRAKHPVDQGRPNGSEKIEAAAASQ
jgi:peptidoglycan/LPS O-acetylase OafA/YrhL